MTSINKLRRSLKFQNIYRDLDADPSSEVAEILSTTLKYEWIVVDMEHGSFTREKLPDIVRAISLNSVLPFVRLESNNTYSVKHVVDCGFMGYIVPMIEDSLQLDRIYKAITYPPSGERGVGFSRSNQYGINFERDIKEDKRPLLVGMIESKKA